MLIAKRNRTHLDAMRLVEHVSQLLGTISWIWGGYTTDIYLGRILREHDDLDYLTLNLHPFQPKFVEVFSNHGWQTKHFMNGDLRLKKEDVKVHLGNVELDEFARWTHNGEKGSLLFPRSWLNPDAVEFYGTGIHVVSPELQYVLKKHPEFLNPDWQFREKDILDKEYLRDILLRNGADLVSLHKLMTSIHGSVEEDAK